MVDYQEEIVLFNLIYEVSGDESCGLYEFDAEDAQEVRVTGDGPLAANNDLGMDEIEVKSQWHNFSSQDAFVTQQPRYRFYKVTDKQLDFIASQTMALNHQRPD